MSRPIPLGILAASVPSGGAAPTNTAAPLLTTYYDSGMKSNRLECTTGTWTGSPTSYNYAFWQTANTSPYGLIYLVYSGVDSGVWVGGSGDRYVCIVTATNGSGSTDATSNAVVT